MSIGAGGAHLMTDEKADNNQASENDADTNPSGHLGDDTTIVLRDGDGENVPSKGDKQSARALGTTIGGHYRLESRIGSGGSSAVYLAQDLALNRKVALKLLLSGAHYSDEERLRFQREGRAVGSLDHPHIVRVFEFNTTENDEPYLVMEYLQGQSLTDIIKERGVLKTDEFVAWTIQVVQALSYAHKRHIIHRDVKSSNIVIVRNDAGESIAKVVDFGLARPEDEVGKGLTLTGTIFGSPHYMSPEQCRGERVDARSDIYSLGCVMYECLTGSVPFSGASMLETFRMHTEDQPKPFAARLKDAQNAADIEKVVFKCLAKNPADRYADADKLDEDLRILERNSRSGFLSSSLSFSRKFKADTSARFGKFTKPLIVLTALTGVFALTLALKPQIITDYADKHWAELDLDAQHAFDNGDLESANKYYEESVKFAAMAPVSRRDLRETESVRGQLDVAIARHDEAGRQALSAKLKKIEPPIKLPFSLASLEQSLAKLKPSDDPAQKKENTRQAVYILNSANDAAEVLIQEGHLLEASELLQSVYNKTNNFIPDNDSVIPRSLLNLVAMFINTDPHKSFVYMTKSDNILKEQNLPKLAKARFLSDLARAYLIANHPEKSMEPLTEAIEIYRYENSLTGLGAGIAFLRMAECQIRFNDAAAASNSLGEAEHAFAASERKLSFNTLRCNLTHAEILLVSGQVPKAMAIIEKELDQQEKLFPKNYHDLSESLYWYVRLLMRLPYNEQNAKKIDALAARCWSIWIRTEHNAFAGTMAMNLGDYQARNRRLVDAEKSYNKCMQIARSMRNMDYYSQVSVLNNLSEILMRRGQYQRAYDSLKLSEQYLAKANTMPIGAIAGIQPATTKYLYKRLAECTEKLGMREEHNKYAEMVESSF
jgi:hypothetical protein